MLRTTLIWTTGPGTPYYTNLYFGGTGDSQAQSAGAATRDFSDALEPHVVNDLAWSVSTDIASIDPVSGDVVAQFNWVGSNHAGAHTGAPLSWASQGLIQWRTGQYVAGREIRGRTFIPGVPASYAADGNPSGSYITNILAAATALRDDADTASAGGLVVWSPTRGDLAPVSILNVWNRFAVLRSRRPV